ncbi:MAG: YciI family protein [Kofleriaceae bacterium]|nr:YciI family protein [Kofleriaceae bacterium]
MAERALRAGTFVVSGRKVPRDGGIIIANGHDRDVLEAIVRQDPFVAHGLADYRLVEFNASQRAADVPKRFA